MSSSGKGELSTVLPEASQKVKKTEGSPYDRFLQKVLSLSVCKALPPPERELTHTEQVDTLTGMLHLPTSKDFELFKEGPDNSQAVPNLKTDLGDVWATIEWSGRISKFTHMKDIKLASLFLVEMASSTSPQEWRNGSSATKATLLNLAVATLAEFKPTDAFEAQLISQMVSQKACAMRAQRWADVTSDLNAMKVYAQTANKLFNQYQQTVNALETKRRGGEQNTTQHVNVGFINQAIIGNIGGPNG